MIWKLFVNHKKNTVFVLCLLLLSCFAVGGTLAFLVDSTSPVENTFTPVSVPPTVVEKIEGNIKKEVTIKNAGDTSAYIRAKVIVTWQDEDGNVYGEAPVNGTDYSMTIPGDGNDTKWLEIGDNYYYTEKVAAGDETAALLKDGKLEANANAPSGYNLHMEIIAQTIQATPSDAVEDAWPAINVSDGKLVKAN